MTITHIQLRDARDRLLDLLGIGQTYPLQDLAVHDEQLTVTFNTTAKIPIDNSQQGVLYQLYDHDTPVQRAPDGSKGPGEPIVVAGNGTTIQIETYKIEDDTTFQIYARKAISGRAAYLHQTATVKVGLDLALAAWIQNAVHLDPTLTDPTDTAPRLIDYGATVDVQIAHSQEGVDYRLVYLQNGKEITLSVADVRGDLHDLVLHSQPINEDLDIRIRAIKTFDPSEHRATQTDLLKVVLPLKVRANPALPVTVKSGLITDFKQTPTLTIANTQMSAKYKLFIRTLPDRDFIHGAVTDSAVLKVPVENTPDVQIRAPLLGAVWTTPDGYTALGDFQAGNGSDLPFTLPPLTDDSLVIVQAQKDHQADQVISSAVPLTQVTPILVRPDPAPPLRIRVVLTDKATDGKIQLFAGQPGVFYHLRTDLKGSDLGLPAYFHKRDDQDPSLNKGLGQLTTEVDFVIARSLPPNNDTPVDLAATAPLPPILTTGPLPVGTSLHVLAVKAQTGVATPLAQTIDIGALPPISVQDAVVDYNSATKLLVSASQNGDKYQPLLNGDPVKRALNGNGSDLSFNTDPLTDDTEYDLLVTRPNDAGFVIERVVKLPVLVRPNTKLTAGPASDTLVNNTGTAIRLEASQVGVSYQLLVDAKTIGDPILGNGATLELATGPLMATTTFAIQAVKVANPDIRVTLDQQVTVQVQPAPNPQPPA